MDKIKLRIGILASATFHMAPVAVVGAIPLAIYRYGASPTAMQTIFALPALAAVPMSLIIGSLANRTGNKIPLQIGILAMILGGLAVVLFDLPLAGFVAAMALMGLGLGCLMTLTAAIIADNFRGAEQSKAMAHMSAFANLGGMVLAAVGGVLMAGGFRYAFWLFAYGVLVLVLNQFLLPRDRKGIHKAAAGKAGGKIKLNTQVFILCGMTFILGTTFGVRSANAALLLVERGLGEPAAANYATTFWTAAGILAGLLYGMSAKALKRFLLPVFAGLFAVGMLLIGNAAALWVYYLGHVVSGMAVATVLPTIISRAARSVDLRSSTFVISMIFATLNLSNFTAPAIVNTIARLVASETARVCFNIGAVFMGILCIITFFTKERSKANEA